MDIPVYLQVFLEFVLCMSIFGMVKGALAHYLNKLQISLVPVAPVRNPFRSRFCPDANIISESQNLWFSAFNVPEDAEV